MSDPIIYWTKFSAIAQAAGAISTFLAVVVSLFFALNAGKPRLRLKIGERIILGDGNEYPALLMFEVANSGNRPVQIKGIGWETGWLRWGPSPLKRKNAIQLTGNVMIHGIDPPYEVQPGMSASSYAFMENILTYASERKSNPLFVRDWPLLGRRKTRVYGYAYTADGFTVRAKPEPALIGKLVTAEKLAKAQIPG